LEYKEAPKDAILASRQTLILQPDVLFVQISSKAHGIVRTFKLTKSMKIGQGKY